MAVSLDGHAKWYRDHIRNELAARRGGIADIVDHFAQRAEQGEVVSDEMIAYLDWLDGQVADNIPAPPAWHDIEPGTVDGEGAGIVAHLPSTINKVEIPAGENTRRLFEDLTQAWGENAVRAIATRLWDAGLNRREDLMYHCARGSL